MPPVDDPSRETPTGRAVGRNVAWHNFSCFSGICYALGHFYRNYPVTEKQEMHHNLQQLRNISYYVFFVQVLREYFIPLVPPLACHCNMDVFGTSRKMLQNCYLYYVLMISLINLHILRFYRIIISHQYSRTCIQCSANTKPYLYTFP